MRPSLPGTGLCSIEAVASLLHLPTAALTEPKLVRPLLPSLTHCASRQAGRAPLRVRQLQSHLGTHEAGCWGQQQAEPTVPVASDSDHDCLTCQPSLCGHHGVCSLHASATEGWRMTLLEQPGTSDLPTFMSHLYALGAVAVRQAAALSLHQSAPLPQAGDCL